MNIFCDATCDPNGFNNYLIIIDTFRIFHIFQPFMSNASLIL